MVPLKESDPQLYARKLIGLKHFMDAMQKYVKGNGEPRLAFPLNMSAINGNNRKIAKLLSAFENLIIHLCHPVTMAR
jgi:hypothetical protein